MEDAPIQVDLSDYLPEGAAIVGHVAAVKYISAEGELEYLTVADGISSYEQIGLAYRLKVEAQTDAEMAYLEEEE